MAAACALAIFRGKIIFIFGIAERLRTLRYPIFTGGVVKANSSFSPCPSREKVDRENPQIFPVYKYRIFLPLFMRRANAERI